MPLPISQLVPGELDEELALEINVLKRTHPSGTILFIDIEGSGDFGEAAHSNGIVQALDLLLISMSSSVSYIIDSKIDIKTIKEMAFFGEMYDSINRVKTLNSLCRDNFSQKKIAEQKSSVIFDRPQLSGIVKDGLFLLPDLDEIEAIGTYVKQVRSIRALDYTK